MARLKYTFLQFVLIGVINLIQKMLWISDRLRLVNYKKFR